VRALHQDAARVVGRDEEGALLCRECVCGMCVLVGKFYSGGQVGGWEGWDGGGVCLCRMIALSYTQTH
jgi:hypothetical protein